MKKPHLQQQQRLMERRMRKTFKRRRKKRAYSGANSAYLRVINFWADVDRKILHNSRFHLYDFFKDCKFIDGTERMSSHITFPRQFSLTSNFDTSCQSVRNFVSTVYNLYTPKITLDFSMCDDADQSAIFFLQILKLDLQEYFDRLDLKLKVLKRGLTFEVIKSKQENVNKLLLIGGFIREATISPREKLHPVHSLGYHRGSKSQKHFLENRKGIITTNIVKYINDCLLQHEYAFKPEGINEFEGLITEILNNAEDHSPFNTYYASGNFLKELSADPSDNVAGEVNISIMNFGYSISEGFEKTKEVNKDTYDMMQALYEKARSGATFFPFSRENMFTLYALQDGVSRLKYEDNSRGTGTMKFINSFFSFGDYEDSVKQYHPNLTIFSGKTELICDNAFKPAQKSGMFLLSLNKDNNLAKPPEKSHLRGLKYPFPGTLLSIKIYLNKEHIDKKLRYGNGN